MRLEIKKIGNSTGLILPKELLARLRLEQGDSVLVTEGPDRTITVAPQNAEDEETAAQIEEILQQYAPAFRALART